MARILAFGDNGSRSMPLAIQGSTSSEAAQLLTGLALRDLFPHASHPEAALAGLWLYFGCFDQSHSVSQDLHTPEGSYWHAILHRQEPDAANSFYWFRRVGRHEIFGPLLKEAGTLLAPFGVARKSEWDPFAFVDFCEKARRRPGSAEEEAARAVQLIEWQLLFDYCARPDGESGGNAQGAVKRLGD